MKITTKFKYLCVGAALAFTAPSDVDGATATPIHQHVFSPAMSVGEFKKAIDAFEDYTQLMAVPGTKILVFDGFSLEMIGQFEIPLLKRDSPAARRSRLSRSIKAIERWHKEAQPQLPVSLKGTGFLRIPEIVDELSVDAGPSTRTVFWGSVLYQNLDAPQFNFVKDGECFVPSRLAFNQSAAVHPFGVLGKAGLNGAAVFMIYEHEPFRPENRYKEVVKAHYDSYFTALRGAGVYGFGADERKMLALVCSPQLPERSQIQAVPTELMQPADLPLFQTKFVQEVSEAFQRASRGKAFAVGIAWSFAADLDLNWVWDGGAGAVSYHNKSHGQALYLGDKRRGNSGWEIITFRDSRPSDKTAFWVNVYAKEPNLGRETALLLIRDGDRFIKRSIMIPQTAGDRRRGFAQRDRMFNDWISLDWVSALDDQ